MEKSTLSKIETNHLALGSILVLVGGVLAVIFSLLRLGTAFFLRRIMTEWIGNPLMPARFGRFASLMPHMARWVLGFMIIGSIVSVVLGIIAIYAYTRVKGGKTKSGGLIAIIVGIIMLVGTHWLVGVITLVGGVICYASTPATPTPIQPQPEKAST
jgi:hypothetical protein